MTALEKGAWEIRRDELGKVERRFEHSTRIITHWFEGRPVEEEIGDEKGAAISTLAGIILELETRVRELEKELIEIKGKQE